MNLFYNFVVSKDLHPIDFGVASEPGYVSFRGTLGYVDKKLLDGGDFEACPHGDLYGLGITLLEWFTGSKSIPVDLNRFDNKEIENNELHDLCGWFNKIFGVDEEFYTSATDMKNQFEAIFMQTKDINLDQDQDQEDSPIFHESKTDNVKSGGESIGHFSDHFVSYLNSIHNLGANNKYALAEAQAVSEYFGELYEPFSVAKTIYERLMQDEDIVIVLTGHAGDGKSALALDILKKIRGISPEQHLKCAPKDIERVDVGSGKIISILKDMSEQPSDNRRSIIENSLKEGSGNWLIVSNTGPLLKAFSDYIDDSDSISLSQVELEDQILEALNSPVMDNTFNDDHALQGFPKPVVLANLTKVDNIEIAVRLLKKMGKHSGWKKCGECLARSYCHIYSNVGLMTQSDSPVFERVAWLYQRLNEYDSRMTLRQMAAHLAFSITGGQECKEICERIHFINNEEGRILEQGKHPFSENFFGFHASKPELKSENLYCIRLLMEHHFGSSSSPTVWRSFNEGTTDNWFTLPALYKSLFDFWVRRGHIPKNVNIRQSLRRLVYLFANFHKETMRSDTYIEEFLRSPMLRSLSDWRKCGKITLTNQDKKKLLRRILSVLLEEFSGFSADQYDNSSPTLYLSLCRTDRQIFQSAQMISSSFSFRDFQLEFSVKKKLPILRCTKGDSSVYLVLSLPMLDYVILRSRGGLVEGLDPIYLNQFDQFRAKLLNQSEGSIEDGEITLLHVDVEGKVKVHRYELDENTNILESL